MLLNAGWYRFKADAKKIGKLSSASRVLRFLAGLTTVWLIGKKRSLERKLRPAHKGFARGVLLFFVSLLISYGVVHLVNVASISYLTLSGLFTTIGATLAGIVAIVFALSIFAQQHAAEMYSSAYFQVYLYDVKHKLIYALIVLISLMFFAAGFFCAGNPTPYEYLKPVSVYATMALVTIVFLLIDWQYQIVISKVDPMKGIDFLERSSRRIINRIDEDMNRSVGLTTYLQPDSPREEARQQIFNKYYKQQLASVEGRIENLFEISLRLANRRESMSVKTGLEAVQNIVMHYFDLRRTSSAAFPSPGILLAYESDSQDFLDKIFQKFNNVSEEFLREGRSEYVLTVLDIYGTMAKSAKEIKFTNAPTNPVFDQIVGYLGFLGERGMRENDQEIVWRFCQVLGDVSLFAVEANLYLALHGLLQKNLELAEWGI